MLRGDLYHCHAFAQDLETFYRLSGYVTDTLPDDLIAKAEELFRKARVSEEDFRKTLEEQLNVEKFIDHVFKGRPSDVLKQGSRLSEVLALFGVPSPPFTSLVLFPDDALSIIVDSFKDFVRSRFGYLMGRIQKGPQYVSEVIGHFYFSKAREYQMAGILETKVKKNRQQSLRKIGSKLSTCRRSKTKPPPCSQSIRFFQGNGTASDANGVKLWSGR